MIKPLEKIVNKAYKIADFAKEHTRKILITVVTGFYSFTAVGCVTTRYPNASMNIYPYSGPPHKITSDYKPSIDTEANRLLVEFPENIPGARMVEKYYNPNAVKLLVHIKRAHLTDKMPDEIKKEVERVQQDCYSILSFLHDKGLLSAIYAEGYSDPEIVGLSDEVNRLKEYTNHILSYEEKLKTDPKNWELKVQLKKAKQMLEKQKKKMEEITRYNAVARLYFEKKIEVRGGVNILAHMFLESAALAGYEKGDLTAFIDLNENNEYAVLYYIFQSDDTLCFTIYGGAHDWLGRRLLSPRNNIAEWMEEHPAQPISLIEITPKSYK